VTAIPEGAIWVRLPRFVGDGLMMGQVLEPLRAEGRVLVAWGPEPVADLHRGSTWFDHAVGDASGKPGILEMARLLSRHRPLALLNFPRSERALLAATLAFVPLRLGWTDGGARWVASRHALFHAPGHQADRYDELLRLGFPGLPRLEPRPFRPRPEAMEEAARLLAGAGVERPPLVLSLGAAAPIKRLATEVLLEFIPLVQAAGHPLILMGGDSTFDRGQAEELKARHPELLDFCGRCSWPVSGGLLALSCGVLANDSGLAHLAAASGLPLLTVFGPTRLERTAPRGPHARSLRMEELDCLGCLEFVCARGDHACMRELRAERMWELLASEMAAASAAGP